jgi:hypothetical protein
MVGKKIIRCVSVCQCQPLKKLENLSAFALRVEVKDDHSQLPSL